MTDAATIRTATSVGAIAFGVAGALAPRKLAEVYGTDSPTPEQIYTVRLWAGANAAIGAVGLMQDGLDDERFLKLGLALNLYNTLAGLTSKGSARSRILTTVTALAFSAATVEGLRS